MIEADWRDVLARAADLAEVVADDCELIRDGSNAIVALDAGIVARIGPAGSAAAAHQHVAVSRWLREADLDVVSALDHLPQAIVVDGRPVTWWHRIPPHRHATPAELGAVLRRLHAVPIPGTPSLPAQDPFHGLDLAAQDRSLLTAEGLAWWDDRLASLRAGYETLLPHLGRSVVHGDAWQGNVVVPLDDGRGPVLVDLDHLGVGPPEWDLVPIAVDHTDFARIGAAEYQEFVGASGRDDVTRSPAFPVLAAAAETRWTAFTIRRSRADPRLIGQVRHRLSCLRGEIQKPWTWEAA